MELSLWPTLIGIYLAGWLWTAFSVRRVYKSLEYQIEQLALLVTTGKCVGPSTRLFVGFFVSTFWVYFAAKYLIKRWGKRK